jgi:putative ABC transport system substrate-binding protein
MPQRSSLLSDRGVLSFLSKAREALDVKRREFITLIGGAAAWPLGARARRSLVSASSVWCPRPVTQVALRRFAPDFAISAGSKVAISSSSWAEGDYDRLPALAEERGPISPS